MNRLSKLALLSLGLAATLGPSLAAPAVGLVAKAFPETSTLWVQMVVSLSSFFILPSLFFECNQ